MHVSELSWKHVDHPSEVVQVGEEVEVEVLDVDLDRERVSLSLKATQEDPWKEFERTNKAGEIIDGQVTKLVPFGAFIRVANGIEGLVHISELAEGHVESPEAVLSVGDQVRVKVIDVDVQRRRVSLSMRQVPGQAVLADATEIEEEPAPGGSGAASDEPEAAASGTDAEPAASPDEATASGAATPEAGADAAATPETGPESGAESGPEATDDTPAKPADSRPEPTPTDAEVSLESILQDLKRREGRSD